MRVVVDHLVRSVAVPDEEVAAAVEAQARRAEAHDDLADASDAWMTAARMSVSDPVRVGRALSGLRLVIEYGLDYAGTDDLLDLLAGRQLEGECALWVEWISTLRRSDADPDSALAAQWLTIRRARSAAPDTLRALLWDAAMNAWSLGEPDQGLRAAREYRDVEARLPTGTTGVEPPWTGTALVAAGLFQSGQVAEARPLRARAIAAAADVDPAGLPFDHLLSIVFLDDVLLDTSPEAGNRLLVAIQRAEPSSAALACLYGIRAWRARASGDWATAIDVLERGRPMAARCGAVGAQVGMAALAVELAALRGRDHVLQRESSRARAQATRAGDRRRLATIDRAMGLRALADGRLDEAEVALAAAADVGFLGRGLRDAVLPARVDLVEVLARRGDGAHAVERAMAVRPLLEAMGDPLALALERRCAALTAPDDDVAAELLFEALAAHARGSDPFEEARTRLLLGRAPAPRRTIARRHAATCSRPRGPSRCSMREPWLARTRLELRAAGGQAEDGTGLSRLTAQERAVALAAASGRSNREVAESLFLSPRTVEYHLGSVYRKLGIRGRAALARRLAEMDAPVC